MVREEDAAFYSKLDSERIRQIYDSPFYRQDTASILSQFGVVLHLIPKPPAKIIDLGCGFGWTSCFLSRMGYDVLGQDISPEAVTYSYRNKKRYEAESVEFVQSNYQSLEYESLFDCALFFSSLHHAENEDLALRSVYRVLKPGGIVICSEPGSGHEKRQDTIGEVERYGVTEKDMPPSRIIGAALRAGFRRYEIYADAEVIRPEPIVGVRHLFSVAVLKSIVRRALAKGPKWIGTYSRVYDLANRGIVRLWK